MESFGGVEMVIRVLKGDWDSSLFLLPGRTIPVEALLWTSSLPIKTHMWQSANQPNNPKVYLQIEKEGTITEHEIPDADFFKKLFKISKLSTYFTLRDQ